jgi:DNA-directed RNA polymerase subunit M/transcription elongation factor TFIIS
MARTAAYTASAPFDALSVRVPRQRTVPTLPTTPSSLVKLADSQREKCPACQSPRLTEIAMTLTDGSPVQFTSCRHCEYRAWTQAGLVLPVDLVISKATKPR